MAPDEPTPMWLVPDVALLQMQRRAELAEGRADAAEAGRDIYRAELTQLRAALTQAEQANMRLRAALETVFLTANEALTAWDADQESRVGKLLAALAGRNTGYRSDIDQIHAAYRRGSGP